MYVSACIHNCTTVSGLVYVHTCIHICTTKSTLVYVGTFGTCTFYYRKCSCVYTFVFLTYVCTVHLLLCIHVRTYLGPTFPAASVVAQPDSMSGLRRSFLCRVRMSQAHNNGDKVPVSPQYIQYTQYIQYIQYIQYTQYAQYTC